MKFVGVYNKFEKRINEMKKCSFDTLIKSVAINDDWSKVIWKLHADLALCASQEIAKVPLFAGREISDNNERHLKHIHE